MANPDGAVAIDDARRESELLPRDLLPILFSLILNMAIPKAASTSGVVMSHAVRIAWKTWLYLTLSCLIILLVLLILIWFPRILNFVCSNVRPASAIRYVRNLLYFNTVLAVVIAIMQCVLLNWEHINEHEGLLYVLVPVLVILLAYITWHHFHYDVAVPNPQPRRRSTD